MNELTKCEVKLFTVTLHYFLYQQYMSNHLSMPSSYNPGHEKLDIKYIL